MNDLKWADVAHMYAKNESCIILEIDGVGKRELLWQQGTRGVMYATSAHALHSRWSQHKPILRHLEDMTEDHAKDMYSMMFGDPREVLSQWKRSLSWAKDFIAIGKFEPRLTVWLLSQGFDLFGLIESEQAIRRPKD